LDVKCAFIPPCKFCPKHFPVCENLRPTAAQERT